MDDAVQAIMIAFSVIVFVIALSISVYLIHQVTFTSEYLAYYSDSTRFYDNIDVENTNINSGEIRYVSIETIIPTLYRYYKENFCVKIYGTDGRLIQIFDVNLEGKIRTAAADTKAMGPVTIKDSRELKMNKAYYQIYNNPNGFDDGHGNNKAYYMFGVPWLGNTESLKQRVDLFINGDVGYINNERVDYQNNEFAKAVDNFKDGTKNAMFTEQFINYSYSGETITTDDGEVLVDGAIAKDKTIIIYRQVDM